MGTEFPVTDEGILALRLKMLHELGNKKYPRDAAEEIAAANGITFEDLKALVIKHGWPNPDAMLRSAEVLERRLANNPEPEPSMNGNKPPSPLWNPPTSGIVQLLESGEASAKATTKRLAGKIREDLAKLEGLLDAEHKEAEAAKKAEEMKAIEKEIADLKDRVAQREKLLASMKGEA